MTAWTSLSSVDLSGIRWKGGSAFQCLAYSFTVRWNSERLGRDVRRVLGVFAFPPDSDERRGPHTPGAPPSYSLVDLGPKEDSRYRLLYGDAVLIGSSRRDDALHLLFWHVNSETFVQAGDFLMIHAGAVVSPGGDGVLLPGEAGSGKTTLTAGLVRAGFGYLSDEGGAIDLVTGRLYPYPRSLSLRAGSSGLFAELKRQNGQSPVIRGRWYLRPDDIRPGAIGAPCPLRFVIAPTYRKAVATDLTPVSRATALGDLWNGVWNHPRYGARALYLLAMVMREARAFRLVFGSLDEAIGAVTELTLREGSLSGTQGGRPYERRRLAR